ncbi:MAG: NAD(P)/FAD-dependent oxidoreductase [Legionellaceae bacterium]|nr:NAD(P)/FAD-dependent oxidoreductase [Legionellaceae bacterium]
MKVIIVGAGPVGLTAGVELARRNIQVEIIDKKEHGSILSRAVGINPLSLKILETSGVSEKLIAEGIKYHTAHFYRNSTAWVDLDLTAASPIQYGYNYMLGLPQDRTEAILSDTVTKLGGVINFNTQLKEFSQHSDGVIVKTNTGKTLTADYLIGADGMQSMTRDMLGIKSREIKLPEVWSIADIDAKHSGLANSVAIYLLERGKMVFIAPIGEHRFRLVSNTPKALDTIPVDLEITNIRREAEFKIIISQVDSYQKGRVFLAGDAAHSHSPVGGRGMNLGIADAADLAQMIAQGNVNQYTKSRHSEGKKIIAGSEILRKILGTKSPFKHTLILWMFKIISRVPILQKKFASKFLYG